MAPRKHVKTLQRKRDQNAVSRKRQSSRIRSSAPHSGAGDQWAIANKASSGISLRRRKSLAGAEDQDYAVRSDHGPCISALAPSSVADDRRAHDNNVQADVISATDSCAGAVIDCYVILHNLLYARKNRIRISNALGAWVRTRLGWSLDLSEKERKKIEKEAAKLIAAGGGEYARFVDATKKSMVPFEKIEAEETKQLEKMAVLLPVWHSFAESVVGFGKGSLGIIIGMTGDLHNYANRGKLWKRLGIAVIDGQRQGSPGAKANAEDWIRHGYSPKRRSLMWVIGDTLLKAQVRKVKDVDGEDTGERVAKGKYGELYLRRKEIELARVGLNKSGEPNRKHAHLRAQRYVEQRRLVSDLLQAWKAVMPCPNRIADVDDQSAIAAGHSTCISASASELVQA